MRRSALLGAILSTIVLVAACGTGDAGDTTGADDTAGADTTTDTTAEATTELSVTGVDSLAFEPAEFTVPAGEEITLHLTAEGVEHDFNIQDAAAHGMAGGEGGHGGQEHDAAEGDLAVAHADAGQTVTGTFMLEQPGTYEVYCAIPGHRDAGMVATLTVVNNA